MPEIVIDGSKRRTRFLVLVDDVPVYLTGNSFMYFVRLACARCREGTDGWCHKLELQPGSNQIRYIYRMKNEIIPQIQSGWPMVENNRLGYYRLCASGSSIHFNMQNLKDHPIYELHELLLSMSDFNLVKSRPMNGRNNTMNDLTNVQKALLCSYLSIESLELKKDMPADVVAMSQMLCPQWLAEFGDHFRLTDAGKKVADEYRQMKDHEIQDAQVEYVESKSKPAGFEVTYGQLESLYQRAEVIAFERDRTSGLQTKDHNNLMDIAKNVDQIIRKIRYYVMTARLCGYADDAVMTLIPETVAFLSTQIDAIRELAHHTRGDGGSDGTSIRNIIRLSDEMLSIRNAFTMVQHA